MADYEPYEKREVLKPISNCQAMAHIIKGAIGTGILGLPYSWKTAGLIPAFILTILLSILSFYALHMMIGGMYKCARRSQQPYCSFPVAAELSFSFGPPFMKAMSPYASLFASWILSIKHFGTCCVYLIFVSDNLKKFSEFYSKVDYDHRVYLVAITLPAALLFLIKNLKALSPISAVANFFALIAFFGVMYYVFEKIGDLSQRKLFTGYEFFPQFYGTILFAATSIGVFISVESEMKTPQDFLGYFGLLNQGGVIVVSITVFVSFCGYWRYGEDIQTNITMNLPDGEIISQAVLLLYLTAIFFSVPIQGYISHKTIWTMIIGPKFSDETRDNWEYLFRAIFILIAAALTITIHFFDILMSIVGGVFNSTLLLIIPSFMDIGIRYEEGYGPGKIYLIRDIIFILGGLFAVGVTAYSNITKIIERYS